MLCSIPSKARFLDVLRRRGKGRRLERHGKSVDQQFRLRPDPIRSAQQHEIELFQNGYGRSVILRGWGHLCMLLDSQSFSLGQGPP